MSQNLIAKKAQEMHSGLAAHAPPSPRRRTQAERTALSDARMFEAAMLLIVEIFHSLRSRS